MSPFTHSAERLDAEAPPRSGGRAERTRRWVLPLLAGLLVAAAAGFASFAVVRAHAAPAGSHSATSAIRPPGIPADVSTSLANMMGLQASPGHPAPGFTLTDQHGKTHSLSSFRGHVVVLEFMDDRCHDICPIVSQEFVDAEHDLSGVHPATVFAAVNVNKYALTVADVSAFSHEHRLSTIPTWHFFTGPLAALRKTWRAYGIYVSAPSPTVDVRHTSIVYFIAPDGQERFVAAPQVDHTKSGKAYLPAGQISAWGRGIASVVESIGN